MRTCRSRVPGATFAHIDLYILSAAYAKFVSIILIAEAQENAELGDSEKHVEQEQEEDTNVEGDGNGGASGKL